MADPNQAVVVWNVCGINSPTKRNAIKSVISSSSASVVCLQETKVQDMTLMLVQQCLGVEFDVFYYVHVIGTSGGVLLACKSSSVMMSNPHISTYAVTTWLQVSDSTRWWFTGVYGPQRDSEKVAFLHQIREIWDLHAGPWC